MSTLRYVLALKSNKSENTNYLPPFLTQNVAVPNLAPRGVLVVDSWSAFSNENIMQSIPDDMESVIRQIPEGATGKV